MHSAMKRSAQTSQWDNISKRIKRHEVNIEYLDSEIANAKKERKELVTWRDTEFVSVNNLTSKLNYFLDLPPEDRKFWNGTIRVTRQEISDTRRNIERIQNNIDEFSEYMKSRVILKNESIRRRDEVVTAYADPKHNEQYDVWPDDDDSQYETIYLPNGETKTRLRQPVYLPNGEVADYQDAYWRYPHPIGPLTNEQTATQYFDNDGNLVLDLNPNPTNQVPYTVDWL